VTWINVIVEGQTEESFINDVLAPSLWGREIYLRPLILGKPGHKGGRVNYARLRKDIVLQLKQERTTYLTTMLDLYGLEGDFPGMPLPDHLNGAAKADAIEASIYNDILANFGDLRPDLRFRAYFQVNEFEGLLFSDTDALARSLGQENLARQFQAVRDSVQTPEDINDNPNTAPSKRIGQLYRAYRKVIDGTSACKTIGLGVMRDQCRRFNAWVTRLESSAPLEFFER
jgi:hypothetical protein